MITRRNMTVVQFALVVVAPWTLAGKQGNSVGDFSRLETLHGPTTINRTCGVNNALTTERRTGLSGAAAAGRVRTPLSRFSAARAVSISRIFCVELNGPEPASYSRNLLDQPDCAIGSA